MVFSPKNLIYNLMKWILNRQRFLNEAKIRDYLLEPQIKKVKSRWGEKYLDYEEVTPTKWINQGKWKLSEEDKYLALGAFFMCNFKRIFDDISKLVENEKLVDAINNAVDYDLLKKFFDGSDFLKVLQNFDIKKPTLDQISLFTYSIFKKININETRADSMIQKDENGRPIQDENGNMLRVQKNPGDILYTNNLVSLHSFINDYSTCFGEKFIDIFSRDLYDFINIASSKENDYEIDFEILNKDIYLVITHDPKFVLNMSISKFYSSCQHLYTGGYASQLLSNVFDPNSIPAFLLFETEIYSDDELISEFLPLSRMMIRSIEEFNSDDNPKIFFDRSYPDRMNDGGGIFSKIVEKYSQNINESGDPDIEYYYFTPDIDIEDTLDTPYMDRLGLRKGTLIGKNIKKLYLSRLGSNMSSIKISPEANIKEIIIDTDTLPTSLDFSKLKLNWLKFKYLSVFNLEKFKDLNSNSIAFEKCKISPEVINGLNSITLKNLQFKSCDLPEDFDYSEFSKVGELDELQFIYSLNNLDELKNIIQHITPKKLTITSDLTQGESKDFINELRRKMKVEILGPKI